MLNSSVMHNLSTGAERIKSILLENGDKINDGYDDDHNSSFILNGNNNETVDLSALECSYVDIHVFDDKLKLLNVYMDKLSSVNSRITKEKNDLIAERLTLQTRIDEILKEREKLEDQLKDSKRTVDLLQEELNDKHLQLSALKTRLDGTSCLDINQLKSSISDLKRSLNIEQEKSEHLISKVDGLQLAVEERNNRISQLINELHQVESDKVDLGVKVQELTREKQFLVDERNKLESRIEDMAMDREIESEEARLRLQDSAKANKLIPQLMQLVIRDKNDEITELQNQLEDIKDKLNLVLPYSQDLTDPIAMVDELVNHYLMLKDRMETPLTNQIQAFPHNSSAPNSPRPFNAEPLITSSNNNKSFGSNGSRFNPNDFHLKVENNELQNQLCELQLKYDKIYFTMNNLREENEILKHELEGFREREKRCSRFSRDLSDPISMVDELIDQYYILKDKIDSQLTQKSPIFPSNSSVPDSPRSLNSEQVITSTNKSFGSNGSRILDDQQLSVKNNELENQLCELQLKYDKIYFTMNNLREENEMLKHEIDGLREDKNLNLQLSLPVGCDSNSVNGLDLADKDSDFIDEKDSVEEALIKIHEQSAELLILSEKSAKRSQDTVIEAIIELLPIILLDDNRDYQCDNGGNIDVIGIEFNDLNYYDSRNIFTSDKMDSFLDKFSSRNLGLKLLDKMLEIRKFYLEACEKIKFYVSQNDTISGQLSSVEDALIKAQTKLDVYQKKYDKVKRKLKDRSNEIISQANTNNKNGSNNINNITFTKNNKDNHNSQSTSYLVNKVKVDFCNQSQLYHQYRRCLSHCNSLIYQKRYLLTVLGGYRLTERETLALLAHVKVTTEEIPLPTSDRKRFKSVVIAVIAIHRINHIRLRHSSYPKKINPQFVSSSQPSKVIVSLPTTVMSPLPSSSSSSQFTVTGTINELTPSKCIQTNAKIKDFVTRLQKLHRTLGLQYEARYSTANL